MYDLLETMSEQFDAEEDEQEHLSYEDEAYSTPINTETVELEIDEDLTE